MNQKLQNFILGLNDEQKTLWESYIEESDVDLDSIKFLDNVTGNFSIICTGRGRPFSDSYQNFSLVTVINDGDDWTIFGNVRRMGSEFDLTFSVDLLKSQNLFQVIIGNSLPYTALLNNTQAVSYRTSVNKIVIRALDVKMSNNGSNCTLRGAIGAEIS